MTKAISTFHANPMRLDEVEAILESIPLSSVGIWHLPWGAQRDQVLSLLSRETADFLRSSGSPRLMSYDATMVNRKMHIVFIFSESGGLDEVCFEVTDAVLFDLRPLFRQRYGRTTKEFLIPGLGGDDRHNTWDTTDYEVELDQNGNGGASFSFRKHHSS
jgi:hypothetical protein